MHMRMDVRTHTHMYYYEWIGTSYSPRGPPPCDHVRLCLCLSQAVALFWIDFDGEPREWGSVAAGEVSSSMFEGALGRARHRRPGCLRGEGQPGLGLRSPLSLTKSRHQTQVVQLPYS